MITFSDFKGVPCAGEYKVSVGNTEIAVYSCRISRYPFNTWWPGHQRPIEQSELAFYVNIVADEAVTLSVLPQSKHSFQRAMLKPYSKGVQLKRTGDTLTFTLTAHGGYVLQLDDYHGCLYVFYSRPIKCPDPTAVTHYFGAGVHYPGKIVLKSNESVYLEKDALVYGCVYAENAENVHVFGNGVFSDSLEKRENQHCYEKITNGNFKLFNCRRVRVEGVGFSDSAIWCINLFHCFDVELDGIKVFGQWRYNTDGVDIVNSKHITLKNSFIHSFDDTVTIKGIDAYADEDNTDILVENCALWCDWGKACEIGLETACREYKNITFRNCDVLRGGNTACDIQNGDCAEVHHVTFEDIRLELESSYTPEVLQKSEEQCYAPERPYATSFAVYISNNRFRDSYSFLDLGKAKEFWPQGDARYAGVHDITVRNIAIYADERIMAEQGSGCVNVRVKNLIDTTLFSDICIENISLNGKPLALDDIICKVQGNCERIRVLENKRN